MIRRCKGACADPSSTPDTDLLQQQRPFALLPHDCWPCLDSPCLLHAARTLRSRWMSVKRFWLASAGRGKTRCSAQSRLLGSPKGVPVLAVRCVNNMCNPLHQEYTHRLIVHTLTVDLSLAFLCIAFALVSLAAGCFLLSELHIKQAAAFAAEIDNGLLARADWVGIVKFARPYPAAAVADMHPDLLGHRPGSAAVSVV